LAEKSFKSYVVVMLGDAPRFVLPFRAFWRVGLSEAGQAYVCEEGGRTVLAIQLSGSDARGERWRRFLPGDIRSDPFIAATTAAQCLLQSNYSSPTVATDGNGEIRTTRREGALLSCIGHRAGYLRDREDVRGKEIVLWSDANESVTLCPPPRQKWSQYLSVCGSDAKVAVVDAGSYSDPKKMDISGTLDIFHHHQRESHSHLHPILYEFAKK
jgi:hypothetical protein